MKKLRFLVAAVLIFSAMTSFTSVSANAYEDCPDINVKHVK